jgi:hypothetical protein
VRRIGAAPGLVRWAFRAGGIAAVDVTALISAAGANGAEFSSLDLDRYAALAEGQKDARRYAVVVDASGCANGSGGDALAWKVPFVREYELGRAADGAPVYARTSGGRGEYFVGVRATGGDGVASSRDVVAAMSALREGIASERVRKAVDEAVRKATGDMQKKLDAMQKNLDDKGILWSDDKYTSIFTTSKGIKIGMVGLGNDTNASKVYGLIDDLKKDGAAIIIASCHFGQEGVYEPTARQKKIAHELIDYGVDIVVGTHPHRLQPIEKYNGHYIFYSLSNFCFGGNYSLTDPDSVIIQCDFIMDSAGSECVDYRLRVFPYSQTSTRPGNDFCPMPYEWESEDYFRVMERLEWAQGDE